MKHLGPFWVEAPAAELESKAGCDSLPLTTSSGTLDNSPTSLWYTVLSKNGCSAISVLLAL